jgi:AcrR family transcriptional regulator
VSASLPRIEGSLYSLGYASQFVLTAVDTYWFVLAPTDGFPAHKEELVRAVQQAAGELVERTRNEGLQEIARHIGAAVTTAWSHFRDAWASENHAQAHSLNADPEPELVPEELWDRSSPLCENVWISFRSLLAELEEEIEPQHRFAMRLGGLVGQITEMPFAGEEKNGPATGPSPLESLRECLRDLPVIDPSFAGLRPILSDAFLREQGAARADAIRIEVQRVHGELLCRFGRPTPAATQTSTSGPGLEEEAVHAAASSSSSGSEPSPDAIRAYQLWVGLPAFRTGRVTQENVAVIMSRELGRNISQGTVSRWIKSVRECIARSGIPLVVSSSPRCMRNVDPAVLDARARCDGHTPRQRRRSTND